MRMRRAIMSFAKTRSRVFVSVWWVGQKIAIFVPLTYVTNNNPMHAKHTTT